MLLSCDAASADHYRDWMVRSQCFLNGNVCPVMPIWSWLCVFVCTVYMRPLPRHKYELVTHCLGPKYKLQIGASCPPALSNVWTYVCQVLQSSRLWTLNLVCVYVAWIRWLFTSASAVPVRALYLLQLAVRYVRNARLVMNVISITLLHTVYPLWHLLC